tara:strand:- start:615 stop:1004 length:390 start_codon:yes stop_codon:yes gene_type:complete
MCFKNRILILLSILSILCILNISLKIFVIEKYYDFDTKPNINYNVGDFRGKDLYSKILNINNFFRNNLADFNGSNVSSEIIDNNNNKLKLVNTRIGSGVTSINNAINQFIESRNKLQNKYNSLNETLDY